jgi:hypothetical protein
MPGLPTTTAPDPLTNEVAAIFEREEGCEQWAQFVRTIGGQQFLALWRQVFRDGSTPAAGEPGH